MDWAMFATIVAKETLPLAIDLYRKWQKGGEPTPEEIDVLEAMTLLTARDRAIAMLKRKGVDPESEKGKAFLELVG